MTSRPVKVFQDERGKIYIRNKKGKKIFIKTSLTKDAVQKNFIKEWKKSKIAMRTATRTATRTVGKKPKKLYRNRPITQKEINRSSDTSSSSGLSALDRQVAESKKPPAIGQKDVLYLTVGEKNDMALNEIQKIQDMTFKIMEAKNIKALIHDTSRDDMRSQLKEITDMNSQLKQINDTKSQMKEIVEVGSKLITRVAKLEDLSKNIGFDIRQLPKAEPKREIDKRVVTITQLPTPEIPTQSKNEEKYISPSKLKSKTKNPNYNEYKKIYDENPTFGKDGKKIPFSRVDTSQLNKIDKKFKSQEKKLVASEPTVEQKKKLDDIFSEFYSPSVEKKDITINVEPIKVDEENLKKIQELEAKLNRITPLAEANVEQLRKDRIEERKKQRELRDFYLEDVKKSKSHAPKESKLSDISIQGVNIEPALDLNTAKQKISDIQSFLQAFDHPSTSDFGLTIEIPESIYDQQSLSLLEPSQAQTSNEPVLTEYKPEISKQINPYTSKPRNPYTLEGFKKYYNDTPDFRMWLRDKNINSNSKYIKTGSDNAYNLYHEYKNFKDQSGKGSSIPPAERMLKDLYPDESLYESEIQKLFKEENYQFLPVIAHNEIHKIKLSRKKPTFFVMNLSDRGENGTHWTSTYINEKGNIYYFDSFGRPPDKETKDQLSDLFEQHGDGTNMLRRLKYNTKGVQDPLSSDCGYFSIQFIENMLDGKSFRNSVNITEEDLKDEKIHTKEWM
jgi:hypothetical protein